VDAAFSRFELSDRADYGRFLQAQAVGLFPLERALSAGIAPRLAIEWPNRRRTEKLTADLAALGLAVPPHGDEPPIREAAAALGTVYVLEGSRLGGAVLRRSVGLGLPCAFLAPGAPGLWRDLIESIEHELASAAQQAVAIDAATSAFDRFERAAHTMLAETVR
jgi:heme oxygenase